MKLSLIRVHLTPVASTTLGWGSDATSSLAPKIGLLGVSPKKVSDDLAKATGVWKGLSITVKLTVQIREAHIEAVPSASALITKVLKEPTRDKRKQKTPKQTKNIKP